MSPRAAARFETLGFEQVYDYVAGKADWGAAGLPLEGTNGTRAGAHVRTDVPTCSPDDRLPVVCERLEQSGWDTCFVVDDRRVVLGRLGRRAIRGRDDVAAQEAMTPGPSTDQAQRPARSDRRTNASPEAEQLARDDVRWPARRTADPS